MANIVVFEAACLVPSCLGMVRDGREHPEQCISKPQCVAHAWATHLVEDAQQPGRLGRERPDPPEGVPDRQRPSYLPPHRKGGPGCAGNQGRQALKPQTRGGSSVQTACQKGQSQVLRVHARVEYAPGAISITASGPTCAQSPTPALPPSSDPDLLAPHPAHDPNINRQHA